MNLDKAKQDFQIIKEYYKNLYNLTYNEKSDNVHFPFQEVYLTTPTKKPIDFIMLTPKKINSYDSFIFEVYIFLYEDGKIECSDGYGTFEKFEAYEGSDIPFIHIDNYKNFITSRGLQFNNFEIYKPTTIETFKEDIDLLAQTMLTLNDIQEVEPYIKYPHYEAQSVSISYPNKFFIDNHLMQPNFTPTFELDGECGIEYYVKHFIHLEPNIEYSIYPDIIFDCGKLNELQSNIEELKCISAFHNNLAIMGLFISDATNLDITTIKEFKEFKLTQEQEINQKILKKYELNNKIVLLTTFFNKSYILYIKRLAFDYYDEEDYIKVVNELEECAYNIFNTLNIPKLININEEDYNTLTQLVQTLKYVYKPSSKKIDTRSLLESALYLNVFSECLLINIKKQLLEEELTNTQKQIIAIIDRYI